jgi:hypothetical protein
VDGLEHNCSLNVQIKLLHLEINEKSEWVKNKGRHRGQKIMCTFVHGRVTFEA